MKAHTLCLIVLLYFGTVHSANILGVFYFPSPSHHMLGSRLLKELAKKGHNVTMLSPFPLKNSIPNYTDISIEELVSVGEGTY